MCLVQGWDLRARSPRSLEKGNSIFLTPPARNSLPSPQALGFHKGHLPNRRICTCRAWSSAAPEVSASHRAALGASACHARPMTRGPRRAPGTSRAASPPPHLCLCPGRGRPSSPRYPLNASFQSLLDVASSVKPCVLPYRRGCERRLTVLIFRGRSSVGPEARPSLISAALAAGLAQRDPRRARGRFLVSIEIPGNLRRSSSRPREGPSLAI